MRQFLYPSICFSLIVTFLLISFFVWSEHFLFWWPAEDRDKNYSSEGFSSDLRFNGKTPETATRQFLSTFFIGYDSQNQTCIDFLNRRSSRRRRLLESPPADERLLCEDDNDDGAIVPLALKYFQQQSDAAVDRLKLGGLNSTDVPGRASAQEDDRAFSPIQEKLSSLTKRSLESSTQDLFDSSNSNSSNSSSHSSVFEPHPLLSLSQKDVRDVMLPLLLSEILFPHLRRLAAVGDDPAETLHSSEFLESTLESTTQEFSFLDKDTIYIRGATTDNKTDSNRLTRLQMSHEAVETRTPIAQTQWLKFVEMDKVALPFPVDSLPSSHIPCIAFIERPSIQEVERRDDEDVTEQHVVEDVEENEEEGKKMVLPDSHRQEVEEEATSSTFVRRAMKAFNDLARGSGVE